MDRLQLDLAGALAIDHIVHGVVLRLDVQRQGLDVRAGPLGLNGLHHGLLSQFLAQILQGEGYLGGVSLLRRGGLLRRSLPGGLGGGLLLLHGGRGLLHCRRLHSSLGHGHSLLGLGSLFENRH